MRFTSIFAFLCNLVSPRHSSEPLASEPLKSLNDLIFHTRYSLPVTFDQLRSSYTDHCSDYELRRCTITRIDFCRERRKPRHTYIVAHVAGKSTSRDIGCIRIDRSCPCDRDEDQPTFSHSVPLFAAPAGDRAQVVDVPGRGGRPGDIVFTHTFEDEGPSLLHLTAAGLILRKVERLGHRQIEQCHLFAAAMFRILVGKEDFAAATERMEVKLQSQASRCFGGSRALDYSQCLAVLNQQDVRADIEVLEKQVLQKRRELRNVAEARQRAEKEPGGERQSRANNCI